MIMYTTKRIVLTLLSITFLYCFSAFSQTTTKTKMKSNKELVKSHFQKWATGTGSFFDLLDDQVQWTISGSSKLSKTYTSKKQLLDEVIDPLNKRLSKLIVPTVRSIFEDGNAVIVIWDGAATAADGQPYNVSYAWFMEMKAAKIIKVTAFLDTLDFQEIFDRIKT